MLLKGIGYLSRACSSSPVAARFSRATSGGFLDPIEGTFIVTAIGIVIAAPLGVGIAAWLVGVRHGRVARTHGRLGDRDARGRPERRARALRAARSSRRASSASSPRASDGALGQSFFIAGHRDVADRAAARRRRDAGGRWNSFPPRCARPPLRSARPARRRSATCCCPRSRPSIAERHRARHGADHRRHRDHHDPARRRPLQNEPVGNTPLLGAASRHRLDADELHLLQLARGRGQRAREGLRRRVRAARDRARA